MLSLISFSFFPDLRAERLPIKTYTTTDGLPRDHINRIVQDSRGFLWFCTSEGLSRFDGYKFTNYTENATLAQQEFNRAFVIMQYFAYLRRNPNDVPDADYAGYDFWVQKLNQFNGKYVNAEMIKAFMTSGEYRHRFGP